MPERIQATIATPIGPLYVITDGKNVYGVHFERQDNLEGNVSTTAAKQMVTQVARQLNEYFVGKRLKFELSLSPEGTDFQKLVWKQLAKIPYAKTTSYQDIAKAIGHPKAIRAVGSANGKNPFCVIVPCHRVIASDGTLGGYSGGVKIKEQLLGIEKNNRQRR